MKKSRINRTYINSFRREKEKKERLNDFDNYSIKNPIKNIYFVLIFGICLEIQNQIELKSILQYKKTKSFS